MFSAFSKEVAFEEVLGYNYPYAEGYKGFWENPIAVTSISNFALG